MIDEGVIEVVMVETPVNVLFFCVERVELWTVGRGPPTCGTCARTRPTERLFVTRGLLDHVSARYPEVPLRAAEARAGGVPLHRHSTPLPPDRRRERGEVALVQVLPNGVVAPRALAAEAVVGA